MTFDPRTEMLDATRPPWLDDPKAEPRVDTPFASDRGLREKRRFIARLNPIRVYEQCAEWCRRLRG